MELKQDQLLRVPEVAAYLNISRRQVWALIAAGRLRTIRVSPRATRVDPRDLQAFVQQRRAG